MGMGRLGRAAKLSVDTNIIISNVLHADANFTFSAWLKPDGDFTLDIGDHTLTYDHAATQIQDGPINILRRISPTEQWMHVAWWPHPEPTALFTWMGKRLNSPQL